MENSADKARHAACARALVRRARKAALATIERASGHPFISLVAFATEPNGTPILLLSSLAQHTRNLAEDPRASLLIEATGSASDALAGDRVSLIGHVAPLDGANVRARFLARHPSSAALLDFSDFQFYRLEVARAHFVGGFGR
ncbi:MAG TPA: pyridoxamine 5'-phosphate oxidase family protein, partial [Hyphomicrobiaceae bacterium]|nr:pyridoxamine 5'-phosphate oxidase family protein [Hyphomicrobiaceae bacterium]